MRIVVVGSSGSGKTTMARRLGRELDLPAIELDAINWQPGWRGLDQDDPEEFKRRVELATQGERWSSDGNYNIVRPLLWGRATHIVWLDYPRHINLRRVVWRSVTRAVSRTEFWPGTGNRERISHWLRKDHPIQLVWQGWAGKRERIAARLAEPAAAHLKVFRLSHPREAAGLAERLNATA